MTQQEVEPFRLCCYMKGHGFSGKHAKVVHYSRTSRNISTGMVGLEAWLVQL